MCTHGPTTSNIPATKRECAAVVVREREKWKKKSVGSLDISCPAVPAVV
jgi:hypothetical protein